MSSEQTADADVVVWTARQREVLDLLTKGLTNGQVAEALGISLDGAKWRVSEVIARLGVDTREEAAAYWRKRNGLVGRLRAAPRRRASRAALGWLGMGGALTAVVIAIPVLLLGRDSDGTLDGMLPGERHPAVGPWEQLPDPPLEPRASVIGVWTGEEVLFVGGDTFMCNPFAGCADPTYPALSDGAALDPTTGTWRDIAPAPAPLQSASTAVVGDDVYFLATVREQDARRSTVFLRYSISEDTWEELEPPADGGQLYLYRIVAAGDVVVAYVGTHERGLGQDLVFDPATDFWAEFPADPIAPGWDRWMMFADGWLFLFDHELVPNPGSPGPSLTRVARLDVTSGTWERLPTTGMMGSRPWYSGDGTLVVAHLGGSDGGTINNWGRVYPNGGVVGAASGDWSPLPRQPAQSEYEWSAGVFGRGGASYYGTGGWLLNFERSEWVEMPRLDGDWRNTDRQVVTAGRDAVVFGGARWGGDAGPYGQLLGDGWIWRAPD